MLLKPEKQFTFAGFDFPKFVWNLRKPNNITGGYYNAPKINNSDGICFYLGKDSSFKLRYKYADEIINLRHTGYYADEYGDDIIKGIVFILPHGKGYLPGYTMGENMASGLDYKIIDDIESAAYYADSLAENIAELNREL